MEDYLKSGAANTSNLDVFSRPSGSRFSPPPYSSPTTKNDLYLTGYGREWGQAVTYSAGVAYAGGMAIGGSYGLVLGLRKGGATRKLFINSVLNSCSVQGPSLANRCAALTLLYCGFSALVGVVIPKDEVKAPIAGAFSGLLYQSAGSWRLRGIYSVGCAAIFTGVNILSRNGYI